MNGNLWLYWIITGIYALSLFVYSAYFFVRKISVQWTAIGLLAFVWLLQAVYVLARMFQLKLVPMMTLFESIFFLSWALVTATLVLSILLKHDLVIWIIGWLGFIVLLVSLFTDSTEIGSGPPIPLNDIFMLIHTSAGLLSYVAFTISALFSGLYFFLYWKLKGKRWSHRLRRIPSLDLMEVYAFRTALMGCGFLFVSLFIGIWGIWLLAETQLLVDLKVIASLLLLVAYSFYIVLKLRLWASGRRLALWNLTAYAIMVINFSVLNTVSDFHRWAWFT